MNKIILLIFIIILIILGILWVLWVLGALRKNSESFTVYQLNYRTDIEPQGHFNTMPRYRRCICSSDGKCKCIFDE
jgi:hypothetical protein